MDKDHQCTVDHPNGPCAYQDDIHDAAVLLGRKAGAKLAARPPEARSASARKGGLARARSLTQEQRKEIGRRAARARWDRTGPDSA